jgi:hypothetical protein
LKDVAPLNIFAMDVALETSQRSGWLKSCRHARETIYE